MNEKNHLFSNHALKMLLIPLVAEQFLTSLMGTADSMMVSNVGSAAISAVSLVDSINVLVIQAFAALSAGGTIVCSQYIGQKNLKKATESARQLLLAVASISVLVSGHRFFGWYLEKWTRRLWMRRRFTSLLPPCPSLLSPFMTRELPSTGLRVIQQRLFGSPWWQTA